MSYKNFIDHAVTPWLKILINNKFEKSWLDLIYMGNHYTIQKLDREILILTLRITLIE